MRNGERSRPTGFQFTQEHLQSRIKEENLITDVENAVFDLGVMDPHRFYPLITSKEFIIRCSIKFVLFIELIFDGDNPTVSCPNLDVSKAPVGFVLELKSLIERHLSLSEQEAPVRSTLSFQGILSCHALVTSNCPIALWVLAVRET
ncbi:hypothetical protein Tco_0575480 [Tanacetum coccineum]